MDASQRIVLPLAWAKAVAKCPAGEATIVLSLREALMGVPQQHGPYGTCRRALLNSMIVPAGPAGGRHQQHPTRACLAKCPGGTARS
jgi:hypothetical protein